jgi:hypothetical protein
LRVHIKTLRNMKINFDNYERDLLVESLEYRIENDEALILSENVKEDIQDLLRRIEENEYV